MATVQEIYNEIDRIDNAKSGIAGAIEEKGVEVPAGAKIDEYPELVRQIQQGDTSDCVKFTPQTLTEEQKAQARENIGAGSGGGGGKIGIISQTQTWSGTGSNPRTYVMSDQVTGLIPQANIDLFESAGATFNSATGYFELNGLTDISYEEMKAVYANTFPDRDVADKAYLYAWWTGVRTNIATSNANRFSGSYLASGQRVNLFYSAINSAIEVYALIVGTSKAICSDLRAFLSGANKIKRVVGAIDLTNTTAYASSFLNAYSLEEIELAKIGGNISFAQSSLLSKASLLYMINNAGTATLTITLEGTVYAKCQSGGEWYSDISTALAAHTNISLASA